MDYLLPQPRGRGQVGGLHAMGLMHYWGGVCRMSHVPRWHILYTTPPLSQGIQEEGKSGGPEMMRVGGHEWCTRAGWVGLEGPPTEQG